MRGRFLLHPAGDGLWNMAVDAVLARGILSPTPPLTLRCYAWQPATLSLGHSQVWTEELASRAQEMGLAVVRRETGGRAVLHHEELTYCVCIPADSPFHSSSLPEAYNRINSALAAGLRHLGVEPSQESRKVDLAAAYRRETGGLCFAATAQSEVLWDGRKLVGSAQRQLREGLLQHGSLITGPAHLAISRLFFTEPRLQEAATAKLRRETTTLEEALGQRPAFELIAHALQRGVEESFGIELHPDELRAEEHGQVEAWCQAFRPEHGAVRLSSTTGD